VDEKIFLALDPKTSIAVLEKLSKDENWLIRWAIADNPNCSVSILEELSKDKRWGIRWCVSRNLNCPSWIILKNYLETKNKEDLELYLKQVKKGK